MPHPAATPPVPPPAPVPVTGPLAGLLSEQATLWGVFIALARIGMQFLIRFLPHTATLARNYPRHWHALVESNLSFLRVLLTVRFAPERITISQFRKLWRARQLIESLFGCPLPIFPASPLGARTPSSANATFNQSPSAFPENVSPLGPRTPSSANATFNQSPSAFPLGPRTSSSATTPSPALPAASSSNPPSPASPGNPQSAIFNLQSAIPNPQPHTPQPRTPSTPSVRQVPFCSLSHSPSRSRSDADSPFASDAPSATLSRSRAHKHAPATLQSIIAQLEAQEAQSQSQPQPPHPAFPIPHSPILPPFIPDVNTLHAALRADALPPNCAGALFEEPGDALIKALQQVYALLHAFPQLSPSNSPSPSPSQSSVNLQSSICNPQSGTQQSDAPFVHPVNPVNPVNPINPVQSVESDCLQSEISNLKSEIPDPNSASPSEKAQWAFETAFRIPHSDIPHSTAPP